MPTATEPSPPQSSLSHTFLPAHVPSWRCATCTLELALQDELVSRSFQGASGPAFLWRTVCVAVSPPSPRRLAASSKLTHLLPRRSINADVGPKAKKQLMSGTHLIARASSLAPAPRSRRTADLDLEPARSALLPRLLDRDRLEIRASLC